MTTVSIVTPSLNQGHFIGETLSSVRAQTGARIEHIVIDGGSTDGSIETIQKYAPALTYWESMPDAGQSDAINKGWRRATGEILCWLNSDDTLLPGAIGHVVAFFQNNPHVDLVFGDCVYTDVTGSVIGRSANTKDFSYERFIRNGENVIPQPAAFIRRAVYDKIGELDVSLRLVMDWDYWMRAGLGHTIQYIPVELATARFHTQSKTVSEFARKLPDELESIYLRYFENTDLPDSVRQARSASLANMYLTAAGYSSRGRYPAAARSWAKKAILTRPAAILDPWFVRKLLSVCLYHTRPYQLTRSLLGRGAEFGG